MKKCFILTGVGMVRVLAVILLAVGIHGEELESATEGKHPTRIEFFLVSERRTAEEPPPTCVHEKTEAATKLENGWGSGGSLLAALGAVILMGALFPAAVPVVGRVLAVLVESFPLLAGPAGVVSVKAFDAILRAIEESKKSGNSGPNLPLENAAGTEGGWIDELHENLSRELDASHKALVRRRKSVLGLK